MKKKWLAAPIIFTFLLSAGTWCNKSAQIVEAKKINNNVKGYPGFTQDDVIGYTTCNQAYATKNSIVCKNKSWIMKIDSVNVMHFSFEEGIGVNQFNIYGSFTNNSKHQLLNAGTFFDDHFRCYLVSGKKKQLLMNTVYERFCNQKDKKLLHNSEKYIKPHHSGNFFVSDFKSTAAQHFKNQRGQKILIEAYSKHADYSASYLKKHHIKKLASKSFILQKISQEKDVAVEH